MPSIDDSSAVSPAPRPLFVAGPPRSGTSGFTGYLNRHPEVLVCVERYKYVPPHRISPELFAPERILDYRERETNVARERHEALLEKKDHSRLKWVGDKYPHYVVRMPLLAENNPGARFIVLYRAAEEVAESYEARASNPDDAWPAENGFALGIEHFNRAFRATRRFVETDPDASVLIVDYQRFFDDAESLVPALSRFLEIDFDDQIRSRWARMSARYAERRRPKREITPAQRHLLDAHRDRRTDEWVRRYIARQDGEGEAGVSRRRLVASATLDRVRGVVGSRIAPGRGAGDPPPAPTFLIIGAQKAGTRWLRFNLDRHPDVFTAPTELHYFDSPRHRRGLDWYRAQFKGWSGQPALGESTPGYTMPRQRPDRTAARIDEALPDVRLLVVLRDPAERVLSAFTHHVDEGRLNPGTDLLEYVGAHPPGQDLLQLVAGGLYATNLEPYFERFGERLLPILNEDIRDDPRRVFRLALEHVGVDPDYEPRQLERVRFSSSTGRRGWSRRNGHSPRALSASERAALVPYFAADTARLEEILGRDLSAWRSPDAT